MRRSQFLAWLLLAVFAFSGCETTHVVKPLTEPLKIVTDPVGAFEYGLFGRGTSHWVLPNYPVIFIPGLGYSAAFWEESHTVIGLRNSRWNFGGAIALARGHKGMIRLKKERLRRGDFYTLSFSNSQAGIAELGRELAYAIELVQRINQTKKVILIGHSMGGLVAREYLQGPAFEHDVQALITIGTPHQGSDFDLDQLHPLIRAIPGGVRDLVWKVDLKSDAVRDLRPGSIFLEGGLERDSPDRFRNKDVNGDGDADDSIVGLNDFILRPLPSDVHYVTVIGSGCPYFATRSQCSHSDGVVTTNSQDLNQVPGVNVQAKVITTNRDHLGEVSDFDMFLTALEGLVFEPKV